MREVIDVITQIIFTIGVVGMWFTLGNEVWNLFMIISVIAIIVNLINGG